MSLEGMNCPKCGGQISFEEDQDFVFCSHCGTQIYKDSENKKSITYREINEAKIKELEYEERAELRREKNIKNFIKVAAIFIGFMVLANIVIYYLYGETVLFYLDGIAFIVITFGWMILDDFLKKKK